MPTQELIADRQAFIAKAVEDAKTKIEELTEQVLQDPDPEAILKLTETCMIYRRAWLNLR